MEITIVGVVISVLMIVFGVWRNRSLPREDPDEPNRKGAVIRDVGIIQLLAMIGWLAFGVTRGTTTLEKLLPQIVIIGLIPNNIGFIVAAWLNVNVTRLFRTLAVVALGVALFNVLFFISLCQPPIIVVEVVGLNVAIPLANAVFAVFLWYFAHGVL